MGLTGVKKGVPSILSHRDSLVSYRRYAPLDDKTNKTGDPVLGSIWDTRHFNREVTPTAGAQSICLFILSLPEDPLDWKRQDKETDG